MFTSKNFATLIVAVALPLTSASAALVLVDHPQGATRTTFYDSLTNVATGNRPLTGVTLNRFSLDVGDNDGQSFTLDAAITLDSIYLAYNDQQSAGTFDLILDVGNDGASTADLVFAVTVTNALQSGGNNSGPVHFLQFDLSSESIALAAGLHSFSVEGKVDNGEGAFLIAPMFTNSDSYTGGRQTSNAGRDFMFAVTTATPIPEPASLAMGLMGLTLIAGRRRSA